MSQPAPMIDGDRMEVIAPRVTYNTVAVSSLLAQKWIDQHNTRNRPVNERAVMRYQTDMESGRWAFAADPIRFDRDGVLLDGQHRLIALANCVPAMTIPFLVVRGLDPEAQDAMDQGHKRTTGQQLALHGVTNYNVVAAAALVHLVWERGLLFTDNKVQRAQVTTAVVVEWVETHPELVEQFNAMTTMTKRVGARPGVMGGFVLSALTRVDHRAVASFITLLDKLSNLGEGHPILALNHRFMRAKRDGLKFPDRDQLGVTVAAWNHWMNGRTVSKLQAPKGGWSRDNFPAIEPPGKKFDYAECERGYDMFLATIGGAR
ncbi:hypothetical protein [Mycolicibacterium mageritense]|uniref:hypothetical protein n=1 Tax=Mycolicibacterium mageritense TaxID=53462 RepID=UPI001E40666D|nr:hypothetical protein [Mycolicibacterium mageritense]MCC9181161.1 hypothetical protein [Mycolicibacterium mageritense]